MEFSIKEKSKINDLDILETDILETHIIDYTEHSLIDNKILCKQLEYGETLTINNINLILEYYKIQKGRLTKQQKIFEIILFEENINNIDLVNNRKILWDCIRTIYHDKTLKKYLLINVE